MKPLNDSLAGSDPAYECETLQPVPDVECAQLLHELNNVFVSVLLNTQVMEWKLPSYSRLKRNLHEVQRNAQRGGELVKRLRKQLEAASRGELSTANSETRTGTARAVANQEPRSAIRPEDTKVGPQRCSAPVFLPSGKKVPHTPV